ncbi:MAG: hypothetical protein ACRD6X_08895 [Pyrinomonadaceae bacterium]
MNQQSIIAAAESFGLSVETTRIPGHEDAFKVFKGVKQVFVGTQSAVREFLSAYEKERPGLYEGSIYNYKE